MVLPSLKSKNDTLTEKTKKNNGKSLGTEQVVAGAVGLAAAIGSDWAKTQYYCTVVLKNPW